jgi:hypothetical protein
MWCVSFVAVPGAPGMEWIVFVEKDGKTSILHGI